MTIPNVLKAGGTSVGTPSAMEIIVNETLRIHEAALKSDPDAITVLVSSATGTQKGQPIEDKNTDLLEEIHEGRNVARNVEEIVRREKRPIDYFGLPQDFNNLNFLLLHEYISNTSLPEDQRYAKIVTIAGERLKARQMAAVLNQRISDIAVFLDYDMTGFTTQDGHRFAVRTESTFNDIAKALALPKYKGKILSIGGFMGIDKDTREVTTLERGGSDTGAVYIGVSLGAKQVIIYSDASLMTANPRYVPNARLIRRATHEELKEFIVLGSSIVSERANEAAEDALVELVLRNTFNLEHETVVSATPVNGNEGVKGVAGAYSVLLSLGRIPLIAGTYHKATGVLKNYGIDFINEAGSTGASSMVLLGTPENPIEDNLGKVLKELFAAGLQPKIEYGPTRIGIIGEDLGRNIAVLEAAVQAFKALRLPVYSISYPRDGRSMTLVTQKTNIPRLVQEVHSYLFK